MQTKYLRHKPSGIVYAYQAVFAKRADFEPIPDEPAEETIAPPAKAPRAPKEKPKAAAPVTFDDVVAIDEAALSADASRNLP